MHLARDMSVALPFHVGPKVDVLVVDDNPFMRAAVARILQRQGRRCIAVATVDEAKMTLLEHPPSLVLTDFALGKRETGVDLVRWIRSQPSLGALACGLMSGMNVRALEESLQAVGLEGLPILCKPFALSDLELFLDGLLGTVPKHHAARRFAAST
ncbi:MAG TPA: response regulator [Polyangia bacterium]